MVAFFAKVKVKFLNNIGLIPNVYENVQVILLFKHFSSFNLVYCSRYRLTTIFCSKV